VSVVQGGLGELQQLVAQYEDAHYKAENIYDSMVSLKKFFSGV